jgi:hypothetical protein
MPEGVNTGKARGGAAVMLWLCAAGIFRKAEWSKEALSTRRPANAGTHTLCR